MQVLPAVVDDLKTVQPGVADDALLLAASWEERCLGLRERLGSYSCRCVLFSVYDGSSRLRDKHIELLVPVLSSVGHLEWLPALHANPLGNVRSTISTIRRLVGCRTPRISLDVSSYTRKHLLQLLQGLDHAGMLGSCHMFYTEPKDYHTQDDEPLAKGISAIEAIPTFGGSNRPSRESLLILFLGYEGRRTLALWEHVEPHVTLAVIPDPPYREEWRGRTEAQNRYLLSCLPKENIYRTHSLIPYSTEALLMDLACGEKYNSEKYNYRIAPFGTRAQILGIYRFWRRHAGLATIVYARPVRYREEQCTLAAGRTWLLDTTEDWPDQLEPI